MKELFIFSILAFLCFINVSAQSVVRFPMIGHTETSSFSLVQIEQNSTETIVSLEINCYEGMEVIIPQPNGFGHMQLISGSEIFELKEVKLLPSGRYMCQSEDTPSFQLIFGARESFQQPFDLKIQEGEELLFGNVLPMNLEEALKKANEGSPEFLLYVSEYYQGQYEFEAAEKYLNTYLELRKSAPMDQEKIRAVNRLSALLKDSGRYEEASALAENTLKALPENSSEGAELLFTIGDVYQIQGNHSKAIEIYLKYIDRLKKANPQIKSNTYSTLTNLVMYSYMQLPDNENKKPIFVGIAHNPAKTKEGIAEMKIFTVGADFMSISSEKNTSKPEWIPFEKLHRTTFSKEIGGLYFQFKDKKERISSEYFYTF